MPQNFTSPVGRFVQGDAFVANTKDQAGNVRVVKSGPNAGQPSPQFFMAVAFKKDDPAWPAFYNILEQEARLAWPTFFPSPKVPGISDPWKSGCINPKFSWKIMDGDGVDDSGKQNSSKEGFAGHWVVKFSSSFAPKIFHKGHYNEPADLVTDKSALQRGFYVRIVGSTDTNKQAQKPGIYVNLNMVEIFAVGPVIISGPDAATAFGATEAQAPAGMLQGGAAPAGGAKTMTPAAGGATYDAMIAAGWTDATLIANGMMTVAAPAPATPPTPPATPPAPPAPPAPAGKQMTPAAGGATYEAMLAAGWTDAAMIAAGMMVAPAATPPAPPATVATPPAPPYDGYMTPPAPAPAPAPATIVAPPPAPPAPAPAGKQLLPHVQGTYDAYIAAGWTDATLVANGMMSA